MFGFRRFAVGFGHGVGQVLDDGWEFDAVDVAEAGGPLVGVVIDHAQGPAAVVFEGVVVPARGAEVLLDRLPAFGVVVGVVEVQLLCGRAAARSDAAAFAHLDVAA